MLNHPLMAAAPLAILLGTVVGAAPRQSTQEDAAVTHFRRAVDSYVELHRQVERGLPTLAPSQNPHDIYEAISTMQTAMQAARRGARQGDLFTPEVSRVLRMRLREALAKHGYQPADLLEIMQLEALEYPADPVSPVANEPFQWEPPPLMVPCLLHVLPALPDELMYRFVGPDLVLIDLHANLVVDVLSGVLIAEST
jgi:hypothetical protein